MNTNNATSVADLPAYFERGALSIPHVDIELMEPHDSPTRHLSALERATVRLVVPAVDEVPAGHSMLHQATLRLALFQRRGDLRWMSGTQVAQSLQRVFWSAHPSPLARRGWELLRALDESGFVEVWVSAAPLACDDQRRHRALRLRERTAELESA